MSARAVSAIRARLRAWTLSAGFGAAALVLAPAVAAAQWVTTFDQFYFPDRSNWAFRDNFPAADRLFNAFDYGHAILYERLYTKPGADVSILEGREYDFITRELLVRPPRVPLEEAAIEVEYAKLAPEAKAMFDWAHLLHRQIYDVWADERIAPADKDARIARLVTYYRTRPDLAFSSVPKSMDLMEGQYYSRVFRERYPKFNGLIWAYHWLQVGLYEPLVTGRNSDERQTGILAAVARFRHMLEDAPGNMPRLMPMTAAIAPTFAGRYPEAAIIFDNLHSMHDVVSDILASPKVPRGRKRHEILLAARRYRDATSYAMTRQEWLEMSQMMGVENMGGSAVNVLPVFAPPSVARGASAAEAMSQMSAMHGMAAGGGRDSAKAPATTMAGMDHSTMAGMAGMPAPAPAAADSGKAMSGMAGMPHRAAGDGAAPMPDSAMMVMHASMMAGMMDMHARMMADPVIRKRLLADTTMVRMMRQMMDGMPAEHRAMMTRMMSETPGTTPTQPKAASGKRAAKKAPARKPAATPAKDSMPGMNHKGMPGMAKP